MVVRTCAPRIRRSGELRAHMSGAVTPGCSRGDGAQARSCPGQQGVPPKNGNRRGGGDSRTRTWAGAFPGYVHRLLASTSPAMHAPRAMRQSRERCSLVGGVQSLSLTAAEGAFPTIKPLREWRATGQAGQIFAGYRLPATSRQCVHASR